MESDEHDDQTECQKPIKAISGRLQKPGKKSAKHEEYKIDPDKILKYARGSGVRTEKIKDRRLKSNLKQKEKHFKQAVKQAARAEYLLTEDTGFLEAEGTEETCQITQAEIVDSVDMMSAQKFFKLHLDELGPYKINYTRNGKFLLLSGGKSHLASINWQSKQIGCEIQSQESNRDSCWLHLDRFFAVAQKRYVHIYDNEGTEIHVLKDHKDVLRLHYLPYHFLLASVGKNGNLHYQDTSTGKSVSKIRIPAARCDCMTSNPYNAVIQLGQPNGVVSMWSPTVKEPLVKILCHTGPVLSIATERHGNYMATSGLDGCLKIWDVRNFKYLYQYRAKGKAISSLSFSQRRLLAAASGSKVLVYKDTFTERQEKPYMYYAVNGSDVTDVEFCPYEDVLGIGHQKGFTSILVPGAGEANFDALESNPYETSRQRKEHEVKMLLEKIQPEMITLDPTDIRKVDSADKETKQNERDEQMEDVAFQPKYKKKGRSSSGKVLQRKKGVDEHEKREERKEKQRAEMLKKKENEEKEGAVSLLDKVDINASALDRFHKKQTKRD